MNDEQLAPDEAHGMYNLDVVEIRGMLVWFVVRLCAAWYAFPLTVSCSATHKTRFFWSALQPDGTYARPAIAAFQIVFGHPVSA